MSKTLHGKGPSRAPSADRLTAVRRLAAAGDLSMARQRLSALRKSFPAFKPLLGLAWEVEDRCGEPMLAAARAYEWQRAAPNSRAAVEALCESARAAGLAAVFARAVQRLRALDGDLAAPPIDFVEAPLGALSLEQAEAIDLSRMHLTDEDPVAAAAVLKDVDHPSARNNLALALFCTGDLAQARAIVEANWQAEPANVFALERALRWRCWSEGLDRCLEIAATLQHVTPRRAEDAIARVAALRFLDDAEGARLAWQDTSNAPIAETFGIAPDDSLEQTEQDFFSASLIPEGEWPALIEIFSKGAKSDKNNVDALAAARAASGRDRIDHYLRIFCTAELSPRKSLLTRALADRHPEWLERLLAEQERICTLLERERALNARERTRALVTIAKEVIDRYQTEKERRALLDYDDLIDRTLALFKNVSAAWVLYKLDLGIDHILIDEAQDTSPKQWEIIKTMAAEFMPGGSRPNTRRTLFAVGDEKQSIFSFQGAAPEAFDVMRRLFAKQFDTPDLGWKFLRFHHSFRSGAAVLGSVDQVFSGREVYESVTTDVAGIPKHESLPDAAPGLVELWPLVEPAERKEIEGWDAPFDTESEKSPRVLLAQKIAKHVKLWCANGLAARDVLVLVRQRGPLFEAIIRALKNESVPVAGADRLILTEHIAVMDLMALADCLLLPNDDLALASVLKSPLFGLTEDQLFELAWNCKGSLRGSLRAHATDVLFGAINAELDKLAGAARRLSPFAFFADVLGPRQSRKKFLARLGPEANDALDEFLNLALDYEARETASLQGFLAWLRAAQSEVRRDMEMARDEVRVMTVHGAKGLEANTVILADTTTEPKGAHPPKLLTLPNGAIIWAKRKQDDTSTMEDSRAAAERAAINEYRRLLYVAMTRAAERLVVCGSKGPNRFPTAAGTSSWKTRCAAIAWASQPTSAVTKCCVTAKEKFRRPGLHSVKHRRKKFRCRRGSHAMRRRISRRCAASRRQARLMRARRAHSLSPASRRHCCAARLPTG